MSEYRVIWPEDVAHEETDAEAVILQFHVELPCAGEPMNVIQRARLMYDNRSCRTCHSPPLWSPSGLMLGVRGFTPASGHGDIYRNLVAAPGEQPDPLLHLERLSEEHATVRVNRDAAALVPGDRVRVLPNHACVVSNLVDQAWLMDGGRVAGALPIAARGRIQ